VLGRRQFPPGGLRPLNLTRVDLQGAELDGANLQGAWADEATRWPADWTPETAKDRGIRYVPRSRSD
jgi:Pentapeptide repeats (8 copies)